MKPVVKDFIEANIDLIDNSNIELLLDKALDTNPYIVGELGSILDTIDIDTTNIRWNLLYKLIIKYIDDNKDLPDYQKGDSCDSWARVDYMLLEIPDLGFNHKEIKDRLSRLPKSDKAYAYPLEPEYGWYGSGDYAFSWFNKSGFDKEYNLDE